MTTSSRIEIEDSHVQAVYAYCARRVSSRTVAQDLTSEVLLEAMRSRPPKGELQPWLYGIARQRIAHYYRRHKHQVNLEDSYATESPFQEVARNDLCRQVRLMIDQLPADQREAILLFYVEELPVKQIAIVMGRRAGAVNSLLQRGREQLARQAHRFLGQAEEVLL